MDEKEAKVFYKEYLDSTKVRKEKYVKELRDLYRYLSKGAKVVDIYKAFYESGVNEQGEPLLAIAPAKTKIIQFNKESLGAGNFSESNWPSAKTVALPSGTFPDWSILRKGDADVTEWDVGNIARQNITTKVPVIPAIVLPKSKSLDGYYVLFEVEKWDTIPVAKDPYLLKRINANAFVVLAEWDVTDVELAVMRG